MRLEFIFMNLCGLKTTTSLFLMHNPAVVMSVMRTHTHRLVLTLILTGMESPETPKTDAQKVPRALPFHKHTHMKAPTQTLPQHNTSEELRPQARIQIDSWSVETLNTDETSRFTQQTHTTVPPCPENTFIVHTHIQYHSCNAIV